MSTDAGTAGDGSFLEEIQRVQLPERVERLVIEYEALCGERDRFLWQWIYRLFDEFTLSCVPEEALGTVKRRKTELTVLVTVLDDLGDPLVVGRQTGIGEQTASDALRHLVCTSGDVVNILCAENTKFDN